jgi:hypothetical protein
MGMIEMCQDRKAARPDSIKESNQARGYPLRGGEQIKAKGSRKGGGQPMKRDEKAGSVRRTGIASQALLPGKTPLCTCARVLIPPPVEATGEGIVGALLVKQTVSLRTRKSHARRM